MKYAHGRSHRATPAWRKRRKRKGRVNRRQVAHRESSVDEGRLLLDALIRRAEKGGK